MSTREQIEWLRNQKDYKNDDVADTMEKLLARNEQLQNRYRKLAGSLSYQKEGRTINVAERLELLEVVFEVAKREVDAFDGGYGVTVKHLRKPIAAVEAQND